MKCCFYKMNFGDTFFNMSSNVFRKLLKKNVEYNLIQICCTNFKKERFFIISFLVHQVKSFRTFHNVINYSEWWHGPDHIENKPRQLIFGNLLMRKYHMIKIDGNINSVQQYLFIQSQSFPLFHVIDRL